MLLIWQEPGSRRLVKVGVLSESADRRYYTFGYLPAAGDNPGFAPLAQFPDITKTYQSDVLPAFFANRVMSRRRLGYDEYLSWLGLDDPAEPFEVLIRTGGPRATDTFHIVDDLRTTHGGVVVSRFFASGIQHLEGAATHLAVLRPGQELLLRPQPDNAKNHRAILLDASEGTPVGYVPDWLVDDVHELRDSAAVVVVADRINRDAPSHLKLLCRLEAHL